MSHNRDKNYCKRGHEFTVENTYVRPHHANGKPQRQCRACNALKSKESRRKKAGRVIYDRKLYCMKGHAWNKTTIGWERSRGRIIRVCKLCRSNRVRKAYHDKKRSGAGHRTGLYLSNPPHSGATPFEKIVCGDPYPLL